LHPLLWVKKVRNELTPGVSCEGVSKRRRIKVETNYRLSTAPGKLAVEKGGVSHIKKGKKNKRRRRD